MSSEREKLCRIREVEIRYRGPHLRIERILGPAEAQAFARKVVTDHAREHLLATYLDARHHPIAYPIVSVGTSDQSLVQLAHIGSGARSPQAPVIASSPMAIKSGSYWVTWANSNAKNSDKIDDLDADFRSKVKDFIAALEAAGATVTVEATKRSEKRAYLFHWSWKIQQGKCKPSDPTTMAGVDIQWDHGSDADSKKGAKEMVDGFALAVPPASTVAPALTSTHISGKGIDMKIKWTGTLKVKNKTGVEISIPWNANANANTLLHQVGATYGVKKLTSDAPHWSHNGT